MASSDSDRENEQDSLHAFSGDDTLEHSDSDAASIDYGDQDKVDDDYGSAIKVKILGQIVKKEDVDLDLLSGRYEPKADDGVLSTEPPTPSPAKKARGRPRKKSRLNIIDDRGKVHNNELTKRGRGRPRKVANLKSKTPNTTSLQVKRGRGRPRKYNIDDGSMSCETPRLLKDTYSAETQASNKISTQVSNIENESAIDHPTTGRFEVAFVLYSFDKCV